MPLGIAHGEKESLRHSADSVGARGAVRTHGAGPLVPFIAVEVWQRRSLSYLLNLRMAMALAWPCGVTFTLMKLSPAGESF